MRGKEDTEVVGVENRVREKGVNYENLTGVMESTDASPDKSFGSFHCELGEVAGWNDKNRNGRSRGHINFEQAKVLRPKKVGTKAAPGHGV